MTLNQILHTYIPPATRVDVPKAQFRALLSSDRGEASPQGIRTPGDDHRQATSRWVKSDTRESDSLVMSIGSARG